MPPAETLPSLEEYQAFVQIWQSHVKLQQEVAGDFTLSQQALLDGSSYAQRNMVRCFGAAADAISTTMREVAIGVARLFGRPLNSFLEDKVREKTSTSYHRIVTSYRLIAEYIPNSRFSRIEDERWDKLKAAIAIRNRVLHPACHADLELSEGDLLTVLTAGLEFSKDVTAFCYWSGEEMQRLAWKAGVRRKRFSAKVGRNEDCPCGSTKKFKHCCGKS